MEREITDAQVDRMSEADAARLAGVRVLDVNDGMEIGTVLDNGLAVTAKCLNCEALRLQVLDDEGDARCVECGSDDLDLTWTHTDDDTEETTDLGPDAVMDLEESGASDEAEHVLWLVARANGEFN